jgi:hypothetical protein
MFNTPHKKKAAIKTGIIMALLLISFFIVGLTYLDPPPELGIEVNFGTSDMGSGAIQPMTTKPPQITPSEPTPKTTSNDAESVATQEIEDAPVINNNPQSQPKETTQEQTQPKADPKPDTSESDNALNNILGAPSNTNQNSSGHGDDASGGDKGQIDGNPYANAFYGGGTGNGSGYGLNGRNKKSNQKYQPDCNETGRVVVQIEVDKSGKVVKATPGVQGTTNTAPCLMAPARKTALSYRFNSDNKAPTKQIGFVVVEFSLGGR